MAKLFWWIYVQPISRILLVMALLPILWAVVEKKVKNPLRWKLFNGLVFLVTVAAILYTTVLSRGESAQAPSWRPFYTFVEAQLQPELYRTMLMNIFLFEPIGISLLNLLPKKAYSAAVTVVFAMLMSIGIEAAQFHYHLGRCEVDDVIMNTLGAAIGAVVCALVRKSLRRPHPLRGTEYTIHSPLSTSLTIGLVTDLHDHDPGEVLQILTEAKPDVIALVGDTLERYQYGESLDPGDGSLSSRLLYKGIQIAEKLADLMHQKNRDVSIEHGFRFLREAAKIAPVVMCLGNHEMNLTDRDRAVIAEAGVKLLDNTSMELHGVLFGGIPSKQVAGAFDEAFLEAFSSQPRYKVLLCHHPEYYSYLSRYPIDLILSGHCHGGQIRVCGRGLFAPGQGLLPKYHHGVYDGHLVVSAGCANTTSIPRWGNDIEVVIVKVQNETV